jgi:flagellar biogenesis protein FliO
MLRLALILALTSATPALAAEEKRPTVVGQDVVSFGKSANSVAQTGLYFFAILLLGLGVWRHFESKRQGGVKSQVAITSRTSLGPRAALIVAEVEGQRFLLAQTVDRVSLISKLDSGSFKEIISEEFEEDAA